MARSVASLEDVTWMANVASGGLHIGGGIDESNAIDWLDHGAEKVSTRETLSDP